MSKYDGKTYEGVARILQRYTPIRSEPDHLMPAERSASIATARAVALDFADFFADDNPAWCLHCNQPEDTEEVCHTPNEEHEIEGGFDRAQFLTACGLA